MDDAIDLALKHVGNGAKMTTSGSGGYQFIKSTVDASGRKITRIARLDVNPASKHVQQHGPHLNLETQINGVTVRTGPMRDPHLPIDPKTVRPGDIP